MAVSFSSNDSNVIERSIDVREVISTPADRLYEVYDIQRCVQWILKNLYQKVTLQFPDELLGDAASVALLIEKEVKTKVYILGDTSYGSCCVDEVAASHIEADALIHFHHSCLSPVTSLPVLYIFINKRIDVTHCVQVFRSFFTDTSQPVILIYSVHYYHVQDEVKRLLSKDYSNLISSTLCIPGCEEASDTDRVSGGSYRVFGRSFSLPDTSQLEDCSFFFVGSPDKTLTNLRLRFNTSSFYVFDPAINTGMKQEPSDIHKILKQRYYLTERAKSAEIVGILVGTLGVSGYLLILEQLKRLVKQAGKRSYTIAVGKPNVAKLANFPEVDVFVVFACPECSLFDSKEYYKPILTPFELEVAFNGARDWNGAYTTDFRQLLPGQPFHVEIESPVDIEADVSLVTGMVHRLGNDSRTSGDDTSNSGLVKRDPMTVATNDTSAASFLVNRSWRGLEQRLGETPVVDAAEGTYGTAMGYTNEPEVDNR